MQIDEIEKQCNEWATENLGADFKFRKHQLESCIIIITNVLNNCKTQVMNAPTGSGKSITAMICAGVLNKYYDKKSYILVSDLSLYEQYVADFVRYGLKWGHLKGKDNYTCACTGSSVNTGMCSVNMIPMSKLCNDEEAKSIGYRCVSHCKFIQDRKRAISSPVTLMTYQLYLIQRNYVADMMGEEIFPERDFVICDEAHKLNDIVQQQYAPKIPHTIPTFIKSLEEYATKNKISTVPDIEAVMSDIAAETIIAEKPADIVKQMQRYEKVLSVYVDLNEQIRKKTKATQSFSANKKYLNSGNLAREAHCKFDDMLKLIEKLGEKVLVKTSNENETIINCTYEGDLVKNYFHDKSGCELMMSATMGNFDVYKTMSGLTDAKKEDYQTINIPSTFDFSKSPIYYSTINQMSYSQKNASLPKIIKQIEEICKKHKDEKGIIQTGNYENVQQLKAKLPVNILKRMIFYTSSKEKDFAIEMYLKSTNKILCGPTLLEGLNFDGDKCRFAICMKLPYASLADNLVKAKKELYKDWYSADVVAKLEQGIGRLVRYNGDYGVMYILDGCIANVIKWNSALLSNTTRSRLVKYA